MTNRTPGITAPSGSAEEVTPNDSADLTYETRALWVGGAGNINLDTADGQTVVFAGIPAGTILPVRVKRIRATSTTATNIVAMY